LHADRLQPHEQRRLLVKRLVVDLWPRPVAGHDHLPGDLREVDLVPIEEMHRAQARKEEKGCAENDVELDAQARWHGCEGRIGENAWSRFSYLWIILSWGLH